MKHYIIILLFFFTINVFAQPKCTNVLITDSCILQIPGKKEWVELLEANTKNNLQVQFIKQQQKNYLKIIVTTKNTSPSGRSSLLLLSNNKQFYMKSIDLQQIDDKSSYLIIDLPRNYLVTLKENGLTEIEFNKESLFLNTKEASEVIKKTAQCFFDLVYNN